MKIALIIDRFKQNRGGAERYLCQLAEFLLSRGAEPILFSMDSGEGFPSRAVQVKGRIWPRGLRELRFSCNVEKAIRYEACDLSLAVRHVSKADLFQPHGGSIEGAWQGRLSSKRGLKRILFRLGKALDFKRWVFRRLERQLMRSCRFVAAVSELSAQEFLELYPEQKAKIRSITLGVDKRKFSPQGETLDLRKRIHAKADSKIALFVAQDFELKGLDPALDSLQEKRKTGVDWRLIVIGADPKLPRWKKKVESLALSQFVFFEGEVQNLPPYYRSADLLIAPSFYDPFSLVVAEAQACGLAIECSKFVGAWNESNATLSLGEHLEKMWEQMSRKQSLMAGPL